MNTTNRLSPEVMRSRKRDLSFLICLSVAAYVIGNVATHKDAGLPFEVVLPFMTLTLTALQILFYRVTASYASTRWFKIFYALLLIAQFGFSVYANQLSLAESAGLVIFSYALSLLTYCIVFYMIVRDMFAHKHDATYSLLAAASAYFLIAVIFGCMYSIIAARNPSMLGPNVVTTLDLINRTFRMSHFVVAGFDVPDFAGEMLQNLAVVEAFISNLFIIFVVGRLMANQN